MNRIVQSAAVVLSVSCCWLAGTAMAQDAPSYQPTNHSQFIGSYAIGLLGTGQVNFSLDPAAGPVTVPIIGARYWLDSEMGVDVGLGLRMAGSSTVNGDTTTDIPETSIMVLHAGVPLVMADSQYWVIQVIPEMNLGFAGNTIEGDPDDTVLRGFHFDLGARAGAELHFGFVDIPQLSLQAGIGMNFSYDSFTQSVGDNDQGASRWQLSTAGGPDPWDFLTSNISALYYFGG